MSTDRMLSTLLRSLQTYTDLQDTPRLLSTAASLLTILTNPLNATLLTTQLITAPALWDRADGSRACMRIMGVFHAASNAVAQRELARRDAKSQRRGVMAVSEMPGLPADPWIKAVVKGANERSPRWKHLLVLGGLLIGFVQHDTYELSPSMRRNLGEALVQAVNLALAEATEREEMGVRCIALVLNYSFAILSDAERAMLDYDLLLPVLVDTAFYSNEGLQSAYFLANVDMDVIEVEGKKFSWPHGSASYQQVEDISSRPLVASLGPLARLIAHSAESVRNPWLVQTMMEDVMGFTRALLTQWRQNKLSEIDASEEAEFLSEEARERTIPQLWKLLKSALFGILIVLRAVTGRILNDPVLAADAVAPVIVTQSLLILRSLNFITTRLGANSFSQHTFVYLTAMDILTSYPIQADTFLKSIVPPHLGTIPPHPLDRNLDHYFLNTAEHFTLILSPQTNETLLVNAASPYLAAGGSNNLMPLFEAAHSVMLSVLSAPQSAGLAAKHIPFYIDALFNVFPSNLTPRQFRLAFKTLIKVTSPPNLLAATEPELSATLLEIVHDRALHASTQPLATDSSSPAAILGSSDDILSEQAVLVLTLIDALPILPLDLLEEWLPLAAGLVDYIPDQRMKDVAKRRFWEVIIGGEMDADRSQLCVAWWGTRGGRESLLFGRDGRQDVVMSGALPPTEGQPRESKL